MKRLFLILLAFLCIQFGAGAQQNSSDRQPANVQEVSDADLFIASKFNKNWEFYAYFGAQNFLAEYTRSNTFNDLWCPAIDLNINKWASPWFGFGLGANVAGYKGLYLPGDTKAIYAKSGDPAYQNGDALHMARGAYGNIFAKAMFNATNLLFGYKPNRIFELTGYLGGGIIFPLGNVNYPSLGSTFNAGLNFQFRVSKRLLLGASVRGALISDGFNGISYLSSSDFDNITLDGMIGGTIGIAYKFGYTNRSNQRTGRVNEYEWISAPVAYETSPAVAEMMAGAAMEMAEIKNAEVAAASAKASDIQSELDRLRAENERLSATQVVDKDFWVHIAFDIDKWKITNNEKVDLMAAAEFIKSSPDKKFYVRGYADKQTADSKHNQMLSEKRADAVKDVLVKEFGVDADQLVIEYYGGVDFMYYQDPVCSRSVIISSK